MEETIDPRRQNGKLLIREEPIQPYHYCLEQILTIGIYNFLKKLYYPAFILENIIALQT